MNRFTNRNVSHMIRDLFTDPVCRCRHSTFGRPVHIDDIDLVTKFALEGANLFSVEGFARNGNNFNLGQLVEPFV
ncbi:hypothetical protein D3C76_1624810 [compost metagenome]